MAEDIAFEDGRISNFEGLVSCDIDLDRGSSHTAVCLPSCITHRPLLHAEFHWNRRNFLWTDVSMYGRMDIWDRLY